MEKTHTNGDHDIPPSARLVAYVHDCVLLTPPDEAPQAWACQKRALASASLTSKASKNRLWLQQQHHECDVHPLSTDCCSAPRHAGIAFSGHVGHSMDGSSATLGHAGIYTTFARSPFLANAAQVVVEDRLSTLTRSTVLDWQVNLASAPPHAGGLGIPLVSLDTQ
eukprot:2595499-Amphidinium_carterae.1